MLVTSKHVLNMTLLGLALWMSTIAAAASPVGEGVIEGVVVRAVDRSPVDGAEVVLRVKAGGQLLTAAETTADPKGRFRFEHLPG